MSALGPQRPSPAKPQGRAGATGEPRCGCNLRFMATRVRGHSAVLVITNGRTSIWPSFLRRPKN